MYNKYNWPQSLLWHKEIDVQLMCVSTTITSQKKWGGNFLPKIKFQFQLNLLFIVINLVQDLKIIITIKKKISSGEFTWFMTSDRNKVVTWG